MKDLENRKRINLAKIYRQVGEANAVIVESKNGNS